MVVQTFFIVYLLVFGLTFLWTNAVLMTYAVGFGVGLMVRCWNHFSLFALAAAATYIIAFYGLRCALVHFPWDSSWPQERRNGVPFPDVSSKKRLSLGWPFGWMSPKIPKDMIYQRRDVVLMGLLAGWWVYVLGSLVSNLEERRPFLAIFPWGILIFAVVTRLITYLTGFSPPISLVGRFATGRLIVPGFDQVFVAPLLAFLFGSSMMFLIPFANLNAEYWYPITFAAIWIIAWGLGPDFKTWTLTGNHRIGVGLIGTGVRVG